MTPDEQAALQFLDAMQKKYPTMIPFLSNPALGPFWVEIGRAAGSGTPLTPDEVQNRLWASNWWKTTPESERNWQTLKIVDPKTAAQKTAQQQQVILQQAGQLGISLQGAQLDFLTQAALAEGGLDATTIQQRLAKNYGQKAKVGTLAALSTDLAAVASNYGIPMSRGTLDQWSRNITAGTATQQGFTEYMKNQAKASFPSLQKELDQGMTVKQLADPYLQLASQTLGISAEQMRLDDPKWQRPLQNHDAKGQSIGPMTMFDWQKTLTTDKAYGYEYSANAQADARNIFNDLASTFGYR